MMIRKFVLFFVISVMLLSAINQNAYGEDSDGRSEQRKIMFLQESFDSNQFPAVLWTYGWMGIYSVLTGYQSYEALRYDEERVTNIVGASKSLLGLVVLVMQPLHARSFGDEYKKIPSDDSVDKIRTGEEWLYGGYLQEKKGRSLKKHLISLAIHVVGGGIVWYYEGWKNGLLSTGLGMLVTELNIWTQPVGTVDAYNEYKNKFSVEKRNGAFLQDRVFYCLLPGGLMAGYRF